MILSVSLVFMVSCTGTNEKLERLIPSDAIGVIRYDVPQLLSQAGIVVDGEVKLPQELKDIIDNSDDRLLSYMLRHLGKSGIDLEANAYMFFTKKTYRSVILLALDDEQAARKLVEQQSCRKFEEHNGIDFIDIKDNAYAIDDGVLMIARFNMLVDIDDASRAAKSILNNGKSLLDDEEARAAIDADGVITAFFEMKGFGSLIKKDDTLREIQQRIPLIGIFTDSDIKYITAVVRLDEQMATITTHFEVGEKSEYMELLDVTMSSPSSDVLKVIPASMPYIISMSINGDKFVQLQQMQQMLQLLNKQAGLAGVDIGKLLATVDGPLAIAFTRDPSDESNWDAVLAARSNDADLAMKHISEFATTLGQAPYIQDGVYIYEYGSKMVKMGVQDGIFFIKMLGYDDSGEKSAYELPDVKDFFGDKRVGFFAQTTIDNNVVGYLNYGLKNNTDGEGLFYTASDKDNPALTLIEVLCSIKSDPEPTSL